MNHVPIYERAMQMDKKIYSSMYNRIPKVIKDKEVLEIATGPGLLAKHTAEYARKMIANIIQAVLFGMMHGTINTIVAVLSL